VDGGAAPNTLRGRPEEVTYLGELAERRLRVAETTLSLFELNPRADARDELTLHVDPIDVVLLPLDDPAGDGGP
jgi:hypothetical protein